MVMVNNALKTMPLVYSELKPGDALIFHSNLLHRSEANLSDRPRWSVISCYTSQSNLAYNETSTAWKVPVDIVPDEKPFSSGRPSRSLTLTSSRKRMIPR
jgi:ectoine hydroxylase-related dioxygenase (phytanoyl-CoA dioxygenase family)